MSAGAPMFGDSLESAAVWRAGYTLYQPWKVTYFPSDAQWEVARQMHADWHRIRNQEITITQMQDEARTSPAALSASRDECERLSAENASLLRGEFICARCGIRKNAEASDNADF